VWFVTERHKTTAAMKSTYELFW